jgi:long-chain acyl-CoA synthetase
MSQSMPIVTAYDTLGEEGLRHSLLSTKPRAIFLEPHLIKMLAKTLNDADSIKYVIYNDANHSLKEDDIESLKKFNVTALSFEELRRMGDFNPVDPTPPTPDDLCCIMYTSGSSGPPKGVPLKHRNVVAAGMLAVHDPIQTNHQWPVRLVLSEIIWVQGISF